jgi:hypothetical protein
MAHRRNSHRKNTSRSHKKKRNSKNIINKTIDTTVSIAKSSSKKYMPKVKTGLETIGSKVIKRSEETIPLLQSMTRKFFGLFTRNKTRKQRRH